jgi:hypothetical protein
MVMIIAKVSCIVSARMFLLPYYIRDNIISSKNFIAYNFQIMTFIVINAYPYTPVLPQKLLEHFKTGIHHGKPDRMLLIIIILLKRASGIIRRVYADALHVSGIKGQQGFQSLKIIALYYQVSRTGIAVTETFFFRQKTVNSAGGGGKGFLSAQPLQNGHLVVLTVRRTNIHCSFIVPHATLHSFSSLLYDLLL